MLELETELTLCHEASVATEAVELEEEALVEASDEASQASSAAQESSDEVAVCQNPVGENGGGWRARDVPLEPHGQTTPCGGSPIDRLMTTQVRGTCCREELAGA